MKTYFSKCYEAINNCVDNKSYGLFYSEKHDADENMHLHECYEVLLCITGGKNFCINDRIYEVNDGDIFIINQYEAHKITSDYNEKFVRYVFQIHPQWILQNSTINTDLSKCFFVRGDNISNKISLTYKEKELFIKYFESLQTECDYADDLIKNTIVSQILIMLNKLFSESNKEYIHTSNAENKAVENIIGYINNNLCSPLSLDNIAQNNFISKTHLCRLFKTHLGTTVIKYITSRRITVAKQMLKNGDSVSDVFLKCGFSDYSHFLRTFKSISGISPGKYAKL